MPPSFHSTIKSSKSPLLGTVLTIPNTTIAQLVATVPGDFMMIDMEHAPLPMDVITQMVSAYTAASRGKKFPLVRIPSHGVEYVKWGLDSGAAGIVVPMVNNAAEMRAIIDKAVYPPRGRRSFGPVYAPFAHPDGPESGTAGYMDRVGKGEIALLPMIESKEGLENVEKILALPEVSGTFIGPADLRLSMGLPLGVDGVEEEFTSAMRRISEAAKKHGKVVGTMGMGQEAARARTAQGMDFLLVTFDNGAMVSGLKADLAAALKGTADVTSKI